MLLRNSFAFPWGTQSICLTNYTPSPFISCSRLLAFSQKWANTHSLPFIFLLLINREMYSFFDKTLNELRTPRSTGNAVPSGRSHLPQPRSEVWGKPPFPLLKAGNRTDLKGPPATTKNPGTAKRSTGRLPPAAQTGSALRSTCTFQYFMSLLYSFIYF